MRLYPYEQALLSISDRDFAFRKWLGPKEQGYELLKRASGQDFGYDVRAWAEWGLKNSKITHLRKRIVRSALGIPSSVSVSTWLTQTNDEEPTT